MFKENFKRNDLIKILSIKFGLNFNLSKKIINDIIEILVKNIKTGDLNLKNLGTFKIINKKERIGRNPKTREEFKISSRNSISFKVSKNITKSLDNLYE